MTLVHLIVGGFSTGTGSEGSSTFSSSSLGLTAVLRLGLRKGFQTHFLCAFYVGNTRSTMNLEDLSKVTD